MRRSEGFDSDRLWTAAFGAVVGGVSAAGLYLLQRALRVAAPPAPDEQRLALLEERVVAALDAAAELADSPIDVAALADGIVELSGSVPAEADAELAVELAQAVAGVSTVLNRLAVESLESQLAENRERYAAGDPSLREPHWYGIGVGMGRRRQSPATDPARRDDRASMVERELEVDRASDVGGALGGTPPHRPVEPGTERTLEERAPAPPDDGR
jgi:hypothetical protein